MRQILLLIFLLAWIRPAAALVGCDAGAINDRVDELIGTYLTARAQDALGAAQDLQAGIAALTAGCAPSAEAASTPERAIAPTVSPGLIPTAAPTVETARSEGAPYPAGAVGDTGQGFSIQVTGSARPANDAVESQSSFNPEAGPGEEYVVVAVVVACNTLCDVDYFDFALTGDSGIVYTDARVYYEGRLNVRGAGGTGALPFLIRADETNLRLLYLADRLENVVVAYDVGEPTGNITVENAAPGATATPEGGVEVIANSNLNVREGPGTQFRVAGSLRAGASLIAFGRNADGTWLRVTQGWVFADLVDGDVESLPEVEGG